LLRRADSRGATPAPARTIRRRGDWRKAVQARRQIQQRVGRADQGHARTDTPSTASTQIRGEGRGPQRIQAEMKRRSRISPALYFEANVDPAATAPTETLWRCLFFVRDERGSSRRFSVAKKAPARPPAPTCDSGGTCIGRHGGAGPGAGAGRVARPRPPSASRYDRWEKRCRRRKQARSGGLEGGAHR